MILVMGVIRTSAHFLPREIGIGFKSDDLVREDFRKM